MKKIKGFVIDINGVIHDEENPIGNAVETLNTLSKKYPIRLVSNSTSKSKTEIARKLNKMGFHIEESQIFTPLAAIYHYLESKNSNAYFISTEKTKTEFINLKDKPINYVVVTHAHENFTFDNLNQGFRLLLKGAELIGSGYSKYYKDKNNEFNLDPGPFIKALEFASGKQAIILGKPSTEFFHSAVFSMGLKPHETAMIGDDIETDVIAGMKAGLIGILSKTGKFQTDDLNKGFNPDFIIESFSKLLELLK